jgi:glycosyltransferase involved in cell wall biosynthesis
MFLWRALTMGRLRVMHVVVAGDVGGAERLLTELATRPLETGADHEVALITPNRLLREALQGKGLTVHHRGLSRENVATYLSQSLGPWTASWLVSLLRERESHIVHTHTFGSHVLGTRAARRAALPQVRTEHHVMHYFDLSTSPFTRWAAVRTDSFVAISQYVYSVLAMTAPYAARRATVVRNGVDTAYWSPQPAAHSGQAANARFTAGIFCRLTAWKRVDLAIEAAAIADADLLVVGDGEQRRHLEALAERVGARARFAGHVSDPRPLLAQCDVTLCTSDREPLGLSVLESLSTGHPVIAFAGGGIPEIVAHEVTGWLVTEPTAAGFAQAIRHARASVHDKLPRMGEAARLFAEEKASVLQMCAGYASVYRSLREAS